MIGVGLSFAAMAQASKLQGADVHGAEGGVELTIVTMQFDTADAGALLGVLSKYVVLTRMEPGCRNVDLCSSYTHTGRYLLIQKWDSPEAQRRHFDSPLMVEMAQSCNGLLTAPPHIDLWDGPSAHDLR
jgi:quinol monooxygenase YgiN